MKCATIAFSIFCITASAHAVSFPGAPTSAPAPMPAPSKTGSLLSAQGFPKTFNDLSFTERMEVLTDGYAPWESEYDDKGRCISNCAYPGITIETELQTLERDTAEALNRLEQYRILHGDTGSVTTIEPLGEDPVNAPDFGPIQVPTPQVDVTAHVPAASSTYQPPRIDTSGARCTQNNNAIPSNQLVPYGEPLLGRPRITSPFGTRIHPITKKAQNHKGIDFAAPIGTDIYSPAAGVVDAVWEDKICGKALRITHSEGFATLYCHLSTSLVQKGDIIGAGCLVAKTGNTGRSTGPHLHYGIYMDKKLINPTKFIGR